MKAENGKVKAEMLKLETERLKVKVIKREDCQTVFAFYVLIALSCV